ncbi:MAG: hypothetical protein A3G34_14350 [Candidatus Lindowbacteria bacterium RIFCSPLOWO2_12_FULL_62_27]|nr:MAG: hypothetical protein A3I06_16825 [Candidatus Lindowbacteria bacterium RIFCSPLOWO2_02_FULL_62_12]OGH62742.1 MAG: hypothetical protein A3G34_14350 [Candidatus Lindowbacteria bacterium RIFCSPLOWO2_12_FULL_62_27]
MRNEAYINTYLDGIVEIARQINRADIDRVIEYLYGAWEKGRRIFIFGNGGSAGTASHFAADLNKCTAIEGKKRIKVMSLVDSVPWVSALTNDDGWENVYTEQMKNFFEPGDVALALSVHGGSGKDKAGRWSQNLLKGLGYATDHGGVALGFSGFDGGAMKQMTDACIVVPWNTTPHVESFHVVLHHLITYRLAERIRESA